MRIWRLITSYAVIFSAITAAAVAGEAAREGGARGAGMSPEERAKLAKVAAPLVAKAVAQYVELSAEQAKKFTAAYVAESEAAQKRTSEVMQSGDREKMMALFKENSEKMQEVLKTALTPEQAKKAGTVVGRFGALDGSIQSLLRAKVEEAKLDKALPVLVKFAAAQQELMGKAEPGGPPSEEIRGKLTELREKTAKELAPIIGEEAAGTWQKSGMRGMGFGGGQRRGGQ